MLVPLSWLREFAPYEGTAQALGDKLTMLGLELEDILNPFANIAGIVTGYVAACEPHPDSDHMHCCKVDIGGDEILDIVCGAPNVAQGQKVAVAPVGCRLPDGTVIKKARLRGQPSFGMICSERELGLSEDHGGILVLPDSTVIGEPLAQALHLDTEVLDLSITPNRPDCLSILGVARETAAAFSLPFHVPDLPLIIDSHEKFTVPVSIEEPDLCPLYSGRVITHIKPGQAPMRMRYRLHAVGVRAISNIVDVTNYILMECGQPLHSFDLDKIEGRQINVRTAAPGEKFTTLDGKERILTENDLCICDAKRIIALAGVMGGLNSEIDGNTQNVFLESAVFRPQNIRKTSRRLGLTSEASYRFERGIDQRRSIWALDRASALLASITGGYVRESFSCEEPRPFMPAKIKYSPALAVALLGIELAADFQEKTLSGVGCAVNKLDSEDWLVEQPSWRPDLTRPADLTEEVGRFYGLDRIPPKLPPVQRQLDDNLAPDGAFAFQQNIKHWGAGLGLNEAINYSFTGQKDLDNLNLETANRIAVFNPLSPEQDVLRTCLAPGLLKDLENNLATGEHGLRLFELANAFTAQKESESGVGERAFLGILLYGLRHEAVWPHKESFFEYADLKGIVENLLFFLHIDGSVYAGVTDHPYLSPCVSLEISSGLAGYLGRVKPQIANLYNAQKDVWLCELDLLRLKAAQRPVVFQPLPTFPAIRRDITVAAAKNITAQEILDQILLMKLPTLEGAILLDSYEQPDSRERNLTFRLTFRHPERTLKDGEIDREREKIAKELNEKPGLKI